ncbi:MAG: penicillin-binding protein 2 [Gemmatimonadales bacterium]|nr:penicillin-binding protein 2 [Gemmatimonadales bacterium]
MDLDRDLLLRNSIFKGVVIALFLLLAVNLFRMMVTRHDYYRDQALENRQVRFKVPAPRGRIMDRHGTLLADNMFIADITLGRSSLSKAGPDSTLERLMLWFGLPRQETLARLAQQLDRTHNRRRLVLVPNAEPAQIAAVEERGRQLPGVRVESRSRRRYIYGLLFAHMIGHVGEVTEADLDTTRNPFGYRQGDIIGKQGVEAAFESHLRGEGGVKLEEVNASGRIVGRQAVWLNQVSPGQDVKLAISLSLQAAMAEIIGDQIACGVAIATNTGEVLAAYSNPSFDPDLMTVRFSSQDWDKLVNDPAKPFFNRVVQATYPPASIYKPITSLAGLMAGVVDTNTFLEPCNGGWTLGDRYFKCWKHSGHGPIDHAGAMIQSCDTFYYQLALMLDIDQLAVAARAFGLGRTCSSIFPEESAGNVPDSQWYNDRFGEGKWTRGVMLNNAIGQGELLVTPLQMALFTARIATGGRVPDPVFVISPGTEPVIPEPLPFATEHMDWIRHTLRDVVAVGTGKAGALEGIPVAGKTGTAQNPHGEDHAWFVCYAPADEPEVAFAIIVENAGHGGSVAAPLASRWLEHYFREGGMVDRRTGGNSTSLSLQGDQVLEARP